MRPSHIFSFKLLYVYPCGNTRSFSKILTDRKHFQFIYVITIYKQINIIVFAQLLYISLFFSFKFILDSYYLPSILSHFTLIFLPHLGMMAVVGWGIYIYISPLLTPTPCPHLYLLGLSQSYNSLSLNQKGGERCMCTHTIFF